VPDDVLTVAHGFAGAFLAGEWELAAMTSRGQRSVGQRRVWVRDLAATALRKYPDPPRDRPRELATFLATGPPLLEAFGKARQGHEPPPCVRRWFLSETAMAEPPWPVAPLDTVGDIQALLGVTARTLRWFADAKGLERRTPETRLLHYRYRWSAKTSGGVRLIEEPKAVLKQFQRVVLREIVSHIPPHPDVHGFRPGRSARTYAAGHTGRAVIIHLDLEDFFGSVTAGRVYGIYRRCGYPEPVAHLLTALATNSVPHQVWAGAPLPAAELRGAHYRLGQHLRHPHLPQGAPTSPALANLATYRLDRRLSGLAVKTELTYSRYADDLALSSTTHHGSDQVGKIIKLVTRIAAEEGFRVNARKTSVRRSSQRQRLAGVIINDHPNLDRREFDLLKATLTNAARYGPDSQNHQNHPHFRDHLLGRVAWARHLNPQRGQRLSTLLEQIDWPQTDP
jgi:RNA-directed DNA polymerase